jgi:cell division septal protein FtsQ
VPHVESQTGFVTSDQRVHSQAQADTDDTPKRRRRKQRPRTWARRMKQKFMPAFWMILGLVGLYLVVRTVLNMTALQ